MLLLMKRLLFLITGLLPKSVFNRHIFLCRSQSCCHAKQWQKLLWPLDFNWHVTTPAVSWRGISLDWAVTSPPWVRVVSTPRKYTAPSSRVKETRVTLFQFPIDTCSKKGSGYLRWRRLADKFSHDENTSKSLGDPLKTSPPPSNVSVAGAMASQSG